MAKQMMTSKEPYLDKDKSNTEGGDREENLADLYGIAEGNIEYDLQQMKWCGKRKMAVQKTNGKIQIVTYRCNKIYCPRCGKINGSVHEDRQESIKRRLGGPNSICQTDSIHNTKTSKKAPDGKRGIE
jgi:hypothetical protein